MKSARTGRPILLLVVWALLLCVFAGVAPIVQTSTGVPFDVLALIMLAPAAASVIVLVRPSWFPWSWRRVPAGSVLLRSLLAVVSVVVFAGVLALSLGRVPDFERISVGVPVAVFVALQLVGAACEELGWRGVVQQAGEQLGRPIVVSAIAGFLFGVTHLGYWGLGPGPVLMFGLVAMFMSLTITTIYRGSFLQRLLPATIVHLGLNLTLATLDNGEGAIATTPLALAAAVVMFGAALVLRRGILQRVDDGRDNRTLLAPGTD